jgi:hypothetical protein
VWRGKPSWWNRPFFYVLSCMIDYSSETQFAQYQHELVQHI